MNARERVEVLDDANADLHNAGRRSRSNEAHAASEPELSTWDDVEMAALSDQETIRNLRERLDANRSAWITRVVVAHEEAIAKREADRAVFVAMPAHQAWLRDGGPARLWDRLQASKQDAERCAATVREAKGDPTAWEAIAELEQWRMDEMVRLYLQEDAR